MKGLPTISQSSKKRVPTVFEGLGKFGGNICYFQGLEKCVGKKREKIESLKVVKFDASCQTDKPEIVRLTV